ncbi:unnamed protein product [Clonostachys chloroleuca]|uniref:Uncharacterized protein n=1 Tax=Clonostachys chloroleuca TaxID=1926264 RepID=A0AA35M3J4_9HYPO|nr:unnamed protein product [Clonostachys chloroleuca]
MKFYSVLALVFTGRSLAASIAATDSFRAEGYQASNAFPAQPLFSDGRTAYLVDLNLRLVLADTTFAIGAAYLGDYSLLNNTDAAPVILQRGGSAVSHWSAAPGATNGVRPSWTGVRIAVPSSGSTEHDVVFVDPASDLSNLVDDFALYNPQIFVQNPESSQLEDWWFAQPHEVDGVWKLLWWPNGDDADGKTRIQLRKASQ